jgi:hypothetical protein
MAGAEDINMKLAEALILRADHQKRLEQLKQRLIRAAKVQEGDKPPEEPSALLAEVERTAEALLSLIQRINRTNAATPFDDGRLSDALGRRDVLILRRTLYNDPAQAAAIQQTAYSKSEVRFKSTVDVAELQGRADDLARQVRELDARIQAMNWQVELPE